MKRWSSVLVFVLAFATSAFAADSPGLSPAQLQKVLKALDAMGAKTTLPAPAALNLGFSSDPTQELPVQQVVTDDHTVYFLRSELKPDDYVIWVRAAGNTSSYMFSTHADLKPVRALFLRNNAFPQAQDVDNPQLRGIYDKALDVLGKDVDKSPPPKN
jgi:hypothetical protein